MKVDKDKLTILAKYGQMNYTKEHERYKPINRICLAVNKGTGKYYVWWESLSVDEESVAEYNDFLAARKYFHNFVFDWADKYEVVMKKMEV